MDQVDVALGDGGPREGLGGFGGVAGFGGEGAGGVVAEGFEEGGDVADFGEAAVVVGLDDLGEAAGVGGYYGLPQAIASRATLPKTLFERRGGHESAVLEQPALVGAFDQAGEDDAIG